VGSTKIDKALAERGTQIESLRSDEGGSRGGGDVRPQSELLFSIDHLTGCKRGVGIGEANIALSEEE
jgi:hypothetical protein